MRILGESTQIQSLRTQIERIARSEGRVLIQGENGTGKELVANAIHEQSTRNKGPFVAVNCAAVPAELIESELFGHERGAFTGATAVKQGRFEQANRGTLFLDEIGDMPMAMQSKLLRVLEERAVQRVGGRDSISVDVRVLAATNKDLNKAMKAKTFREDLYFRIAVLILRPPPLRARRQDIPLLARAFLKDNGRETLQLSYGAILALMNHRWPGNVRELRNVMERIAVLTDEEECAVLEATARQALAMDHEYSNGTGPITDDIVRLKRQMQVLEDQVDFNSKKLGTARVAPQRTDTGPVGPPVFVPPSSEVIDLAPPTPFDESSHESSHGLGSPLRDWDDITETKLQTVNLGPIEAVVEAPKNKFYQRGDIVRHRDRRKGVVLIAEQFVLMVARVDEKNLPLYTEAHDYWDVDDIAKREPMDANAASALAPTGMLFGRSHSS